MNMYIGRRGGLIHVVTVIGSGVSGPGWSPDLGHCVLFLGRHFALTVPLSAEVYSINEYW